MSTCFFNLEHRKRFKEMINADKTSLEDVERLSLFYIITGNSDLYRKRKYIYDTYEHCILLDFKENSMDFSYGLKSLIRLGYNLYNGWYDDYTTPLNLLGSLDKNNFELANHAIAIRFKHSKFNALYNELIA